MRFAEADAVLFDAGGVLVLPDPVVLGPLLAPYGGSSAIEVHRRAHYAAMAAKSRAGDGEIEWARYDEVYVELIGVPDFDRAQAAEVLGQTRNPHLWRWPIPESGRVLAELHRRGRPLGVVSNASGQVEATLRRAGICQVGPGSGTPVRCVIDSHLVGVAKPDPRIFDHALVHFPDARRHRVLYIGDSLALDVVGARAAGLFPVLFDPFDDHPHADVDRVRSLHELI